VIRRDVVFAPEAIDDLIQLQEWISHAAGAKVSAGYLDRLENFCLGLELASERGQLREDIRSGLRIVGFEKRITIAFVVDREVVTIIRLFYGGRDWEALLS
jgi:toxin ParE1/3/4